MSKNEEQEIHVATVFTLKSDHSAKEGFKSWTVVIGNMELL